MGQIIEAALKFTDNDDYRMRKKYKVVMVGEARKEGNVVSMDGGKPLPKGNSFGDNRDHPLDALETLTAMQSMHTLQRLPTSLLDEGFTEVFPYDR